MHIGLKLLITVNFMHQIDAISLKRYPYRPKFTFPSYKITMNPNNVHTKHNSSLSEKVCVSLCSF